MVEDIYRIGLAVQGFESNINDINIDEDIMPDTPSKLNGVVLINLTYDYDNELCKYNGLIYAEYGSQNAFSILLKRSLPADQIMDLPLK